MYWMHKNKRPGYFGLFACVLIMFASAGVQAGDDITGEWLFKMNIADNEVTANVCFAKNQDGTYTGTWTPNIPPTEEDAIEVNVPDIKFELVDIKFEDNKISFTQKGTFDEQPFEFPYSGELKGDKIEGKFIGEWGENPAVGTRILKTNKSPVGAWNITIKSDDKETKAMLFVLGKEDGTLTAAWAGDTGGDVISDVKSENGNLSFIRKYKTDANEVTMTFAGLVEDNKLKGKFTSDAGELDITGTRISPSIAGQWDLTTISDRGEQNSTLIIKDDMTGVYQVMNREVPAKDLKYEQGILSFRVEFIFSDNTFEMEFKGKVNNSSIEGEFSTPRGIRRVIGKKVTQKIESIRLSVEAGTEPNEN
jgi:hypothetical protein